MAIQGELADLFEYGIDTKNRRIYFGHMAAEPDSATEFTPASVEFAVRALHKMITDNPNKPIEIHLSSFGGSIYDAMRLHDEILTSNAQIKFFGGGAIMSAATIIMVACDERYVHKNARIMLHELSDSGGHERRSDIKINAQENEALHDIMCDIYALNSRMPKEFWSDILTKDVYVSPTEAVSMGICDYILEPKKRGNLRKKRQARLQKEELGLKKIIKDIYDRTGRTRIPKLEFNEVKKEASDPHLFIDESKMPDKSIVDSPAPTVQLDVTIKKD